MQMSEDTFVHSRELDSLSERSYDPADFVFDPFEPSFDPDSVVDDLSEPSVYPADFADDQPNDVDAFWTKMHID
jgi:hypothetical protein